MSGWTEAHERAYLVLAEGLGWDDQASTPEEIEDIKAAVKAAFDEFAKAIVALSRLCDGK